MRHDGRRPDQLRTLTITRRYTKRAAGSVLIEMGNTRVLCTALVEHGVPPFRFDAASNTGRGWLTAEYSMLPASTRPRKQRDRTGKVDSRGVEIQRLIGRSLRNVVRLEQLGNHTVWLDCDVLDADGGTRTASITGAFVALVDALRDKAKQPPAPGQPPFPAPADILSDSIAAISVGIVNGQPVLDLDYREDSDAGVDMNLVITGAGQFAEVQGTGENTCFSLAELQQMLALGQAGCQQLAEAQRAALGSDWPW